MNSHPNFILYLLKRNIYESPGSQYFSNLKLESMSPPAPNTNDDANIIVKNRTRRCAINLRGISFTQHPILNSRAKMKSKASSQISDKVEAEWQFACERHGFACEPESSFFICTNLKQTHNTRPIAVVTCRKATGAGQKKSNTRPIGHFTMACKWQKSGMLVFEINKHQANRGQKSMGRTMPGATRSWVSSAA